MVLRMCDGVAKRAREASPDQHVKDRELWYRAAMRGHRALIELLHSWGISHDPWYADNSREPLRDEVFREWSGWAR
jgi:Txe/YoeB family toxin of Txe-Axe toxin-antitoxin module